MSNLLWFGPVRTSTALLAIAFVTLAALRRDWRPIVAMCAWVVGFEMAFTITKASLGNGAVNLSWCAWLGWPIAAHLAGLRPDRRVVAATALLWLLWVVDGFHYNEERTTALVPLWEALNEGAKTAWGLAYLVPLVGAVRLLPRRRRPASTDPAAPAVERRQRAWV